MNTTIDSLLEKLPERIASVNSSPFYPKQPLMDIAKKFAKEPGTTLLLSGGSSDCARYSILAIKPLLTLCSGLAQATIECKGVTHSVAADPLLLLKHLVRRYKLPAGTYPETIASGLVGYLSYDLKDCIEELPRTSIDDLGLPHLYMVIPEVLIVEDRVHKTMTLHVTSFTNDTTPVGKYIEDLQQMLDAPEQEATDPAKPHSFPMNSCFTRETYMQAVDAIRDYIVRGHVYQVNMSQRFETTFTGDPFALFCTLFSRNPAPFFAFVNAGDHHIVSTSPERFIELRGNKVETRPIKGTRRRGTTPSEDKELRDELFSSKKDDAELSMIVDLLRNDIGKVCSAGSVVVSEHKRVEAYQNVFHLVSIVNGVLDADKDAVDLVHATFPGGSITGCPKIRAMEVIDELEPVRRQLYTGSIGYISFHDSMDLSIAIRTAIIKNNRLVFSVGGGVVYDSVPADEYEETLHKGQTLMNAINGSVAAGVAPSQKVVAWCNGIFKPVDEISISVNDEGFLYGYGIFETIRVENSKILRLDKHLERFTQGWKACFSTDLPDVTWEAIIALVIEKNGLQNSVAAVKLLAAAGNPATPWKKTLLVTARPYIHRLVAVKKEGLHLAVYPFGRQSPLYAHKSMNYMGYKMANEWAKQQGADEAVILNADGFVSETATANIFCIKNRKWYRPKSAYALAGTMEKAVIEYLEQAGTSVEPVTMSVDELKNADRVFLTNALMGIVPVLRIDATDFAGDPEDVCGRINRVVLG